MTHLTELAEATRVLVALDPNAPEGDDLLEEARNLAATTEALMNATAPENIEVGFNKNIATYLHKIVLLIFS